MVVQYNTIRSTQLVRGAAQLLHHLHRVLHVQVVERLVEQPYRCSGREPGHIGTLPLADGELIEVTALNPFRSRKSMASEM